jgi:hypothetical protein
MRFKALTVSILMLGGATPDARAESLNGAELLALCDTPKSDSWSVAQVIRIPKAQP